MCGRSSKNSPHQLAASREAMLYDLQRFDLSEFNVRAVPETIGLRQQKKYSIETKYSWWRDAL